METARSRLSGIPSGALEFSGLLSLFARGVHPFFAARTANYRQLTASFANNAAGLFGVANVVVVLLSVRVNLHSRSHAIFARCVFSTQSTRLADY